MHLDLFDAAQLLVLFTATAGYAVGRLSLRRRVRELERDVAGKERFALFLNERLCAERAEMAAVMDANPWLREDE